MRNLACLNPPTFIERLFSLSLISLSSLPLRSKTREIVNWLTSFEELRLLKILLDHDRQIISGVESRLLSVFSAIAVLVLVMECEKRKTFFGEKKGDCE